MKFTKLGVHGLRCIADMSVELSARINVFVGGNGAGKTSILEAAYLLSHGQSFRSGPADALQQRGSQEFAIHAEVVHANGRSCRLGLGRRDSRWTARVDGSTCSVARLAEECAVVCFDPGSHALIAGGADRRRRYLNWGVFHVERTFLTAWARFQRALKQRNCLLRAADTGDAWGFDGWEVELAQAADDIDSARVRYVECLRPWLQAQAAALVPELGTLQLHYRRGWPDGVALIDLLRSHRGRDAARGHTTFGVHRADWTLVFEGAPVREHLSRGQEKLAALACVLAQADVYNESHGEWPVVCLDDLGSELDRAHQAAVVAQLAVADAQVLITGTEPMESGAEADLHLFHVEQGVVNRLL